MSINNQNGLTLIESLISILLLAIVATAGMALYHNSDAWVGLVMHRKLANELASSALEQFKATSYSEIGCPGTTCTCSPVACIGTYATFKVGNLDAITSTWNVEGKPGGGTVDYKQVKVKVEWQEAGSPNPKNIELVTFIAP